MRKSSRPQGKTPRRLTPQQQRFANEYLVDLNAAAAARRAGYSAKSSEWLGYQLLQNPLVRDQVELLTTERNEQIKIDAAWVLKRLVEEVNADLSDILNDDGTLKPISDWPQIWRTGLVIGIEVNEAYGVNADGQRVATGVTKKLRLSERIRRIELIARHVDVQAFREKVTVVTEDPLKELARSLMGNRILPRDGGK